MHASEAHSLVRMSESPALPTLPRNHAIAALDGGVGRHGAAAGIVFLHADRVILRGVTLDVPGAWEAEASAVSAAISLARELGVENLRLLIDHHGVASIVQGRRVEAETGIQPQLAKAVEDARMDGMRISARVVQGHAETMDLPSRMNDVAHLLGSASMQAPFRYDMPATADWADRLAGIDRRFRPTRTYQRWEAFLGRRRTAHFLGVEVEIVDSLLRSGHLDFDARGVTRRSAAAVYEILQNMRHDAYFGFGEVEHEPDRWDDEISRGWDGRLAKFYHRKSGIRPPESDSVEDPLVAEDEREMACSP